MKVQYDGGQTDFLELDKADFTKAGVEDGKKLRFATGEPTEVPDAVGEALIAKDGLFGDFPFKQVEEEDEDLDGDEAEAEVKSTNAAAAEAGEPTSTGTVQESTDANVTGTARGGTRHA